MSDQNQDGASGSPSRRSVLAALSSVTTVGLAGCSGDGNGTETPTPSGGDTTETPTPSGSTETPTSSGVNCDDGAEKADIPGEVVHNGIDSINILSHTACRGAL